MSGIIENAKIANDAWNSFDRKDDMKKYFHLRPTNSGVTIVTTLSGYEMRGRPTEPTRDKLLKALEKIANNYRLLVSIDEKKRRAAIENIFNRRKQRDGTQGASLEEVIQATMINTMSDDRNLAAALGAHKIDFIASEVILEKGPYRVDIVGFDRTSRALYLFELKKDRTMKVEQVAEYIAYYESKRETLEKLLREYPIRCVDKFERMKGVMVMRHAENTSQEKWKEIKESKGIEILFYKPSLCYINCK